MSRFLCPAATRSASAPPTRPSLAPQVVEGAEEITYRKLLRLIWVAPAFVVIEIVLAWWARGPWLAAVFLFGLLSFIQLAFAVNEAFTTITFSARGDLIYSRPFSRTTVRHEDVGQLQFKAVASTGGVRAVVKFATFKLVLRSPDIAKHPKPLLISRYGWTNASSLFRRRRSKHSKRKKKIKKSAMALC